VLGTTSGAIYYSYVAGALHAAAVEYSALSSLQLEVALALYEEPAHDSLIQQEPIAAILPVWLLAAAGTPADALCVIGYSKCLPP
jgi:hypothetical protein